MAPDDLGAAVERATALGGTFLMPPTDNDWVGKGEVTDPASNPLTPIQLGPFPGIPVRVCPRERQVRLRPLSIRLFQGGELLRVG